VQCGKPSHERHSVRFAGFRTQVFVDFSRIQRSFDHLRNPRAAATIRIGCTDEICLPSLVRSDGGRTMSAGSLATRLACRPALLRRREGPLNDPEPRFQCGIMRSSPGPRSRRHCQHPCQLARPQGDRLQCEQRFQGAFVEFQVD